METVDGVAVVRLEHGKVNALDIEFCHAISTTFAEHDFAGTGAGVVLTGAGPAFSAGVDLWRVLDGATTTWPPSCRCSSSHSPPCSPARCRWSPPSTST